MYESAESILPGIVWAPYIPVLRHQAYMCEQPTEDRFPVCYTCSTAHEATDWWWRWTPFGEMLSDCQCHLCKKIVSTCAVIHIPATMQIASEQLDIATI